MNPLQERESNSREAGIEPSSGKQLIRSTRTVNVSFP